ncbi:hypothetical protein [Tenacibaculum singaporense]|uniref:hypothetical protein n=1 Tax=Tenacibaculum singaporense TaxID=2358479 RepID=UPI000F65CD8D|nr:hypothetical protein [Tenacibaculum singaporense]RSC92752.1 hypothetical protein EI424_13285 [Tenacibaculum singaporense]
MLKNIKHIKIFILTFALVLFTFSANAQEVRVIDNKGTIQTVNNNTVTTSTTAPTLPLENDVWFDTTNNQIKIYDTVDGWKLITSTLASQNIYTADGTLTSDRILNGNTNNLVFNNINYLQLFSTFGTQISSTGGTMQISSGTSSQISAGTTMQLSAPNNIMLQSPTEFNNTLLDINDSAGTSGQVLTSTGTGVQWANSQQNTVTKTSNSSTSTPATYSFPVGYVPIENDFFIYELASGEHSKIYIYDDGAWEQIAPTKASRIFYPPSIVIDASTTGSGRTINLYTQYTAQFNSPAVGSTSAPATIPTYNADELYYYVTDYDTSILTINSIDDDGLMTYSVDNTPTNDNTIINVVFVVK